MLFSKEVKLGSEKFSIQCEDPIELLEVSNRIKEMHATCGNAGYFRVREAEKKAGKKTTTVRYYEMVKYVPRIPMDKGRYAKTIVKMRISPETDPKYEQWPYFIFKNQRWNWYDQENEKDYFQDLDGKWYEGTYNTDLGEWTRVEK